MASTFLRSSVPPAMLGGALQDVFSVEPRPKLLALAQKVDLPRKKDAKPK